MRERLSLHHGDWHFLIGLGVSTGAAGHGPAATSLSQCLSQEQGRWGALGQPQPRAPGTRLGCGPSSSRAELVLVAGPALVSLGLGPTALGGMKWGPRPGAEWGHLWGRERQAGLTVPSGPWQSRQEGKRTCWEVESDSLAKVSSSSTVLSHDVMHCWKGATVCLTYPGT